MSMKILILIVCFSLASTQSYAEDPAQQFEGFNLEGYTDGGQKAWEVNGDTADVVGNSIELTNVDANSFGEQKTNLKAKTGVVEKDTGKIHLQDDVVITTEKGTKLTTDSLDWERDKDLVTTPDKVYINDKDLSAEGTGAIAHPGLKTAQLNEDVTVKMKTEPKKLDSQIVTITCDGPLVIDQFKKMATFHDNVVGVQDDRILKADKMEVYFDTVTNKIIKTICLGNVRIIQGENTSHSDKAVYDAQTQTMTLSGQPKLILMTEGDNPIAAFGDK